MHDRVDHIIENDLKLIVLVSIIGGASVAGGLSRTFLHNELLYKILLRLLRVG